MTPSYVVTGGGSGVGRAIVDRLLHRGDCVVTIEFDQASLEWVESHAAGPRVVGVAGDASAEAVTEHAADLAQEHRRAGRLGQQRGDIPHRKRALGCCG